MRFDKTHLFVFIAGVVFGLCTGFFSGKAIYDKTVIENVTRDTVTLHDTIPDIAPEPKDSTPVRTIIRWLPMRLPKKSGTNESVPASADTVTQWQYFGIAEHFADTSKMIPVEVPITSKHYSSKDYDAWVSGFEPSLDSIKVYKETQYITETITRTVKDNKHFFLDAGAGCEYKFDSKTAVPFAEVGARLKFGRFGIGAYGGYSHDTKENKGLPYGKAKITYDIISF